MFPAEVKSWAWAFLPGASVVRLRSQLPGAPAYKLEDLIQSWVPATLSRHPQVLLWGGPSPLLFSHPASSISLGRTLTLCLSLGPWGSQLRRDCEVREGGTVARTLPTSGGLLSAIKSLQTFQTTALPPRTFPFLHTKNTNSMFTMSYPSSPCWTPLHPASSPMLMW